MDATENQTTEAPIEEPAANDTPNGAPQEGEQTQGVPPTTDKTDTAPTAAPEAPANDWAAIRSKVAGGDTKIENILSRYGTLEDALKAGVESKRKLDAVRSTKPLTAESTPEEVNAYREVNGIPKEAKDYPIALQDGLVLGEEDQPIANSFLEIAHKNNIKPDLANEIISWNLKLKEETLQKISEADAQILAETTAQLKSPEGWGSEYGTNINRINALLDQSSPEIKDQLWGARLADGTLLGNNAGALKFLDSMARQLMPLATITPTYGQTQLETAETELASLRKEMGDHNSAYWKGPQAIAKQARVHQLNEILSQVKK